MEFALFDNNYDLDSYSRLFTKPVSWVVAHHHDEMGAAFSRLEHLRAQGYFLAGFVAYEAASYFDQALKTKSSATPLVYFGAFEESRTLNSDEVTNFLAAQVKEGAPILYKARTQLDAPHYEADFAHIHALLCAGTCYQVNHTFQRHFRWIGDEAELYKKLRQKQPVRYGAYLKFPDQSVLSRSPELFFEKAEEQITAHPMKGTLARADQETDAQAAHDRLRHDPKQRAENLMIVDMLRNDLGRLAELGSVEVTALFAVETYRTVYQMISKVQARIPKNTTLETILRALFPCASVTGAPKVQAMATIADRERMPRGIYTGAVGFVCPDDSMRFNVPIRTLEIQGPKAIFGIGSGLVYDSGARDEYQECLLKSEFLGDLVAEFSVLESWYYDPKTGPRHLELHLARLDRAAKDLGFDVDFQEIRLGIKRFHQGLDWPCRVRLVLDTDAGFRFSSYAPVPIPKDPHITIHPQRTQKDDLLLRYKTTHRAFYDAAHQEACAQGFYDVLFLNDQDALTETAVHNLILRFGDAYVTPPLACGLLDGIGRKIFMRTHKVQERVLGLSDLVQADEILLASSVRGVVPVRLG